MPVQFFSDQVIISRCIHLLRQSSHFFLWCSTLCSSRFRLLSLCLSPSCRLLMPYFPVPGLMFATVASTFCPLPQPLPVVICHVLCYSHCHQCHGLLPVVGYIASHYQLPCMLCCFQLSVAVCYVVPCCHSISHASSAFPVVVLSIICGSAPAPPHTASSCCCCFQF